MGNLLGTVLDDTGTPQIGATIQLLNKYNHVIAKTLSGPHGQFAFASLPDDVYSLRASVPSFLPAVKNKILVQGGLDSILQVHLATLFSSIELSYSLPNAAMTDDWKWVLRSSAATRPINRLVDLAGRGESNGPQPVFSQTHAVVFLSGGDGGFADSDSSFSDLGTGFALSTNILGDNQVRLSGTFGQSTALGTPQMALMAAYARKNKGTLAEPPEVTLTMTQIGGLGVQQQLNGGPANAGMGGTVPLRAISLATYNATDVIDGVHLEYGLTSESVDYLQHASRISPFGRVTVDSGRAGEIVMAYSAGGQPNLLARRDRQAEEGNQDDLSSAVTGVGRVPEVSIRDGRLRLERTQNAEAGIRKTMGDTTLAASAFYEDTVNGRINVAGDVSDLDSGNLLSDSLSTTSFLSIGNYRRSGYLLSSTRNFGDNLEVSVAYGRMGGFSAAGAQWFCRRRPEPVAGSKHDQCGGGEREGIGTGAGDANQRRLRMGGERIGDSAAYFHHAIDAGGPRPQYLLPATAAHSFWFARAAGINRQPAEPVGARLPSIR